MLSDPIGDFLIRIKNAYLAKKKKIVVPYSKLKEALSKILVEKEYLEEYKSQISKDKSNKELVLTLKYNKGKPAIENLKRISKPGLRIYIKKDEIPKTLGGLGITIISTPKGLMTDKEAAKENLGGEIICQVW